MLFHRQFFFLGSTVTLLMSTSVLTSVSLTVMLLLCLCCTSSQARVGRPRLPTGDPTYVNISFGAIGGMSAPASADGGDATRVSAFIGLPYASPPTEDLRWKPPMDWLAQYAGGLRPAMFYGNACPQLAENGVAVGEEDCLYLNVWVPTNATTASAELLPILFFIHGGSCTSGAGSLPIYDGTKLALSQNAMVVTINYRLGPFGFLAMQTDVEQKRTTGNWGLLDQRSAMRWVQREAKAFGGDASRLTIFGESAGALSVCMHLIMPASAPLFTSAILESRSCKATPLTAALGNATMPSASGSLGLANTSGCGAIAMHYNGSVDHAAVEDCLRRVPSVAVFAAAAIAPGWGPVVDGAEITDDPRVLLAAGRFSRVPIITGSNRDDGAMFTLDSAQSLSPLLYEAALLCPLSLPTDACVLPPDEFSVAQRKQLLALYPARGSGLIDAGNARLMQQIYTDRVFTCPSRFLANTCVPSSRARALSLSLSLSASASASSSSSSSSSSFQTRRLASDPLLRTHRLLCHLGHLQQQHQQQQQ